MKFIPDLTAAAQWPATKSARCTPCPRCLRQVLHLSGHPAPTRASEGDATGPSSWRKPAQRRWGGSSRAHSLSAAELREETKYWAPQPAATTVLLAPNEAYASQRQGAPDEAGRRLDRLPLALRLKLSYQQTRLKLSCQQTRLKLSCQQTRSPRTHTAS